MHAEATILGFLIISVPTVALSDPAARAANGSHFRIARECAELALPRAEYEKSIDKLMADGVQEQVAAVRVFTNTRRSSYRSTRKAPVSFWPGQAPSRRFGIRRLAKLPHTFRRANSAQ
jgi:hypothetical protein